MNKKEWLLDEIQIVGGFIAFSLSYSGLIALIGWALFQFSLPIFLIVWLTIAIIIGCGMKFWEKFYLNQN